MELSMLVRTLTLGVIVYTAATFIHDQEFTVKLSNKVLIAIVVMIMYNVFDLIYGLIFRDREHTK